MKSLYTKFVVYTIAIMLGSGLLSFLLANEYYQQKLKPVNDAKNTRIALDIADFADSHPSIDLDEYLQNTASTGYQFYLQRQDGKNWSFGADFRENNLTAKDIDTVLAGHVFHGIQNFPQKTFVTGFFANEQRNSIGVPLQHSGENYALFMRPDIKLLFNEMHILFGILFALGVLLSIIFVLISTKYLVKPIRTLTSATQKLASGHFDVKLDVSHKDEIGKLAQSFTYMATQLEKTEATRKEFISNVSHDIQSPLSNIKGYTNLLGNAHLDHTQKEQYITIINAEIQRLSDLTKQLLLLTSLDQGSSMMTIEKIDIAELLRELVKQHHWSIGDKNIMLSYSLPANCVIEGDATFLTTVFDNLITNAIKYNKDGGRIDIDMREHTSRVIIQFKDSGIGMTMEQQQQIFERFYRADSSRTHTVIGTGLGLSIVKSMVELHNGSISIDSQLGEGSVFTITFPKEQKT
ncbi:sensor histidine kinase [Kurthia sibirica]|uniref:Heme sensor protein HssS n=1 Tax=Kurthia sibirica TaxID=202750 RepID=A0A2U3AKK2_9BACL|nr:HAMP domain-containing sensor histidine kinase [Kurthia sibirica]PWI25068.1 sensor histidine kinase [Kurthia sibirica]GEK34234.1 two-component sensor histidine kinase [Kurthia sibirica]